MRHAVISSGSRCSPLVIAVAQLPGLDILTNPDERSAGFFALGIAKATRHPAALICTSGTAAGNYFPAVIEAKMSGVPLVVITADRPPKLRGVGAPQTIDQLDLYGNHAVSFEDLTVPDGTEDCVTGWALSTKRAIQSAISASGPVHLNAPFDEPLVPPPDLAPSCFEYAWDLCRALPIPHAVHSDSVTDAGQLGEIAGQIARSQRPVIVCGPHDEGGDVGELITNLAARIHAPVLADVASQVRRYPNALSHYDLYLRDSLVSSRLTPDLILRLGGLPVSKSLNEWIAKTPAVVKIGISNGTVADPYRCLTETWSSNLGPALRALLSLQYSSTASAASHYDLWHKVDRTAKAVIEDDAWVSLTPPSPSAAEGQGEKSALPNVEGEGKKSSEARVVAQICARAGRETILFLSNSMPIRWADTYAKSHSEFPRVFVNRGANGIDGIISTAAGVAIATACTTICVLGDLAFLHDQNGLWRLAEAQIPLKIVVVNNDGGGIFHFLPIASHASQFELLVAMPHGIDLSFLAMAHGIPFHRVEAAQRFASLFGECLGRGGPEIIEVRTDRARNVEHQREIVQRVSRAVRPVLGIE